MRPETVRRVAPLAVAALVLSVIGVVWVVLRAVDPPGAGAGSDGGADGAATTLRLAGWSPFATGDPGPALPARARRRPARGTRLGTGPPGAHLPRADDAATALARALRLPGAPVDAGQETAWQDDQRRLSVQPTPGRPWSYTGALGTVSSDGAVTSGGGGSVDPTTITTDQARATAREFLDAAGLADGVETVGAPGSWVEVQVDPEVGGLPTTGLGTTLVVTADAVQSGAGWLATTAPGPAYPLVTAREAWDALVRTPLPMPLVACPESPPEAVDPVPCGGPVTVTGARLGLSLQGTDDGPMLVPAWLFTVEKSMHPLVQLAVEPRLLTPSEGGGAGGSSGSTGSAGTAGSRPPPRPARSSPPSRFTAVRRGADDRSIDVTFWGGVAECYDYTVRAVEERPDRLDQRRGEPDRRGQAVHRPRGRGEQDGAAGRPARPPPGGGRRDRRGAARPGEVGRTAHRPGPREAGRAGSQCVSGTSRRRRRTRRRSGCRS